MAIREGQNLSEISADLGLPTFEFKKLAMEFEPGSELIALAARSFVEVKLAILKLASISNLAEARWEQAQYKDYLHGLEP